MKKAASKKSHPSKSAHREKKPSTAPRKEVSSSAKASAHGGGKDAPSKSHTKGDMKSASQKHGRGQAPAAPPVIMRRDPTPEEIQYKRHMTQFEGALKLFQHGDFAKAHQAFEQLATISAQDLAQRARVYLNICSQKLSQPVLKLKTADDYYNYGVSMANQGNQEAAEEYLNKALKLAPQSDYIYYALATTQALRENVDGALENLQKAIDLNDRNRYLAQNDSDFAGLGEDPRFTELIYPERPIS